MKRKFKYILPALIAFLCLACEETTYVTNNEPQGEMVIFRSTAGEGKTRAAAVDLTMDDLQIIAPGYGSGASNQSVVYNSVDGAMEPTDENKFARWSAKNMVFTSWHLVEGVTIDETSGLGTVDFTKNLEDFIGAHEKDIMYVRPVPAITLEYEHLVAKFDITLYNEKEGFDNETVATITLPAIKQEGIFKANLEDMPSVSLGRVGNELMLQFEIKEGKGKLECYMPPLTPNELLMYGSFTVKVDGSLYVGTLNSMGVENGIEAGRHYTFDIVINDDHTALLQAVTLAPWDVHPKNIYNRPSDGIWGLEDLQDLAELINSGHSEVVEGDEAPRGANGLTMADLVDENGVIQLFTNIAFEDDDEFIPIGTTTHPFAGYTFEGNGYTISDIKLKNPDESNQGLFGVVGGSTETIIKNLTVKNMLTDGKDNTGILIGSTVDGTDVLVDLCFTSGGQVMGETQVGGLIGYCGNNTVIRNCGVGTSSISGNNHVGGIVGYNNGTIGNSYSNTGSIICYGKGGGLAGTNNNTMRNCYASASFAYGSTTQCGAAAGYHEPGKEMASCHWNTECINNTTCFKVVGNSGEDANGLEQKPSGFSGGVAFNKSNGHIIQSSYRPLYDLLNNYINNSENSEKVGGFLRWAKISGTALPVFSYSNN